MQEPKYQTPSGTFNPSMCRSSHEVDAANLGRFITKNRCCLQYQLYWTIRNAVFLNANYTGDYGL